MTKTTVRNGVTRSMVNEATSESATPVVSPDRERLLGAVEGLSDFLRVHARDAELQRTLPRECVEAMRDAELFAIAAPRDVGGLEVDPLTQMEIIEATARVDTSAGWTLMIGAHGGQVIGAFASDAACERVFGAARWPIAGSQIAPAGGVFERVPDGVRISGRWSFASGVRHGDWSMLTATERTSVDDGAPPRQLAAVLPVADVTVHDNWFVAGLAGTGSCDYSVEDVFVPTEMTWAYPPTQQRGGPRYTLKLPLAMLACFALGAAQRSLDEIVLQSRAKFRPNSSRPVAARPYFQHSIGEAAMTLAAARAGLFDLVGGMWRGALSGEAATAEQEATLSASPAYAFSVARSVTTTALQFGGSSASYLDNVLQRNFRDIAVGAQHFQASEQAYEALGQTMLSLDDIPRSQ